MLDSLVFLLSLGLSSGGMHSFGAVRFVSSSTVNSSCSGEGAGDDVVTEDEGQLRKMQSAGNGSLFGKHFHPIMTKMMAPDAE